MQTCERSFRVCLFMLFSVLFAKFLKQAGTKLLLKWKKKKFGPQDESLLVLKARWVILVHVRGHGEGYTWGAATNGICLLIVIDDRKRDRDRERGQYEIIEGKEAGWETGEQWGRRDSLDDCYIMMSIPGMLRRWVKDDEGREGIIPYWLMRTKCPHRTGQLPKFVE